MEGYEHFVGRFLEHAGVDRVRLLVHDWGVVGLLWAMRNPERVERLVVMNAVPFLPGLPLASHRAHLAHAGRRARCSWAPTNRTTLRISMREARADRGPMPGAFVDEIMAHFDPGTQRAILRLYRSSPEDEARGRGRRPRAICAAPRSSSGATATRTSRPRSPTRYAAALGGPATVRHVAGRRALAVARAAGADRRDRGVPR